MGLHALSCKRRLYPALWGSATKAYPSAAQFCLVDRVVIPIAVRSKEWRHLKRSVSSVFAAACQIKLGGVVLMVTHGFCKAELRVRFSSPPNPLPSADAFESSTAMGDNAMFPETTFNP